MSVPQILYPFCLFCLWTLWEGSSVMLRAFSFTVDLDEHRGHFQGQGSGVHHGLFSGLPLLALLPSPELKKVPAFSQVCPLVTL